VDIQVRRDQKVLLALSLLENVLFAYLDLLDRKEIEVILEEMAILVLMEKRAILDPRVEPEFLVHLDPKEGMASKEAKETLV